MSLIGNLGRDPETKHLNNSVTTKFNIATSEKYKGQDGNMVEKTEWHNIVAWGKTAEACQKYLTKGSIDFEDSGTTESEFIVAMRNSIRKLCLELKAAREVVRTARVVSSQQRDWIKKHERSAYVINTNVEHMGRKIDIYDEVIND